MFHTYRIRHLEWWWYDMVWLYKYVMWCGVTWCDVCKLRRQQVSHPALFHVSHLAPGIIFNCSGVLEFLWIASEIPCFQNQEELRRIWKKTPRRDLARFALQDLSEWFREKAQARSWVGYDDLIDNYTSGCLKGLNWKFLQTSFNKSEPLSFWSDAFAISCFFRFFEVLQVQLFRASSAHEKQAYWRGCTHITVCIQILI